MDLQDHTFVITGGASGLGAATAHRLVRGGARVVLVDMNAAAGEALAAQIGNSACFVRADVTSEADARTTVGAALERFGRLDGLVCCAGVAPAEKVLGRQGPHALDAFARTVSINLVGTFNMVRLCAEAMSRQEPDAEGERGIIICTASVAAFDGQIGQAAYAASKAGVAGMTLPLARELARYGIRVMTIAPGIFETPMLKGLPQAAQDSLGQQVPFPSRLGRPDEYALLVESIVRNPMLNGETIRIDGAIRMAPK